jgi:hypothetical protein
MTFSFRLSLLLVVTLAISCAAPADPADEGTAEATESLRVNGARIFPRSDSCNGEFIVVDRYTNCSQVRGDAWSVLVDGQCLNIADTTAENACRQFGQGGGAPRGPRLFPRSDSCNGEFTPVDRYTNCSTVRGDAWSILDEGRCWNIVDTTAESACRLYSRGMPRGPQIFPRSDSCNGEMIPVDRYTNCSQVRGDAWSILVDGECLNIVDTSAAEACRQFAH